MTIKRHPGVGHGRKPAHLQCIRWSRGCLVLLPHLAAPLGALHSVLLSLAAQAADNHCSGPPRGPVSKHLVMLPWLEAVHDVGSSSWPVNVSISCHMAGHCRLQAARAPVECEGGTPTPRASAPRACAHIPCAQTRPGCITRCCASGCDAVWSPHQRSERSDRHHSRQLYMQRLKMAAPIAALPALCSHPSHGSVLPGRWAPTDGSVCRRQPRLPSSRSSCPPLSHASGVRCAPIPTWRRRAVQAARDVAFEYCSLPASRFDFTQSAQLAGPNQLVKFQCLPCGACRRPARLLLHRKAALRQMLPNLMLR